MGRRELTALLERAGRALRRVGPAIAARRGMPLTVAGTAVVVLAWLGERDSAWGFPMLVAGGLMISLGLLGPRLSGSLAVRWGEDGAFLQLKGTVAPPGQRRSAPALQPGGGEGPAAPAGPADPLVPPTEVESTADTIEISIDAAGTGLEIPGAGPAGGPAGANPEASFPAAGCGQAAPAPDQKIS